jgi:2-polyprenyl-6-methoxyphenol hydroxylase-like FAD-dependent oxidoreductase
MHGRRIVIVGAGIGGLAAAIAVRRAGWDVRVVERAEAPRELGFALALAPNAMAALRELGVADAVGREGAAVDVFEVRRSDGALLKRIDFRPAAARSVVTLRPALHGTLLDTVGPEALLLGRQAGGVTITPPGATVMLTDGTSLDADVVIGADGVGSAIRRQLHPAEAPPRPSGYYALRGVTHGVASRPGDAHTTIYLGDGVEAGAARASASAVYWYISLVDEFVESPAATAADVLSCCIAGFDGRFVSIARGARPEDLRLDRLWTRDPIAEWGTGTVTLLGDAAHPVLPHTAQGAALALEDAVALGLALAPGSDPATALRRYEQIRARRTRRIVTLGPRIAAITTTRSRARIGLRNAAIRMLPGVVLSCSLQLHARDPHGPLRPAR